MSESSVVEMVAAEAGLDQQDAAELIREFLTTIQRYIPSSAWELLNGLVPPEMNGRPKPGDDQKQSIRDLILDLADEEDIESRRAASHARAVAMSLRSRANPAEVQRLKSQLPEDLLALFEMDSRGELTETQPTRDQSE